MQTVLDAIPTHVAVLDARGRILLVNRGWTAFALANGATGTEVGCDYLAAVPAEEGELRRGLLDVLAGHRTLYTLDYRCDAPDCRRWFKMMATPLENPRGCMINHIDITDTKEAEERARASTGLFQELFDQTPDPLTLSDFPDGRILMVNQAWSALTGVGREEAVGRDPAELGVWTDPQGREAILSELRATGVCTESRVDLTSRGGEIHRLLLSCFLVELQGGPKVLMAGKDITPLRLAQEAEARALKADSLVLMAGSIAHDFNNLFAALSAGLDIIDLQARDRPDILEATATAKGVLQRAVALSWKMNDFSGRGISRMVRLELPELLRSWAPASGVRHGGRVPHLDLELVPAVNGDPARLEGVLD
ncbi:MAG: PAS domain-containing protein, partial [Holophaga sp.]|nr:PAS domain-containing protein [Holophaga sp.]